MRTPLIAGNWKMHKTVAEARELARGLRRELDGAAGEVVLCPPFTALFAVAEELAGSTLQLGAQNVHWERQGAFTGEIAAPMLLDLGCRWAIIGHSERRQHFGETDEGVARRTRAALAAGLGAIVCVGERLEEREAGLTEEVVTRQVRGALTGLDLPEPGRLAVAYEPVWAIGTGRPATGRDAGEVATLIRRLLAELLGAEAAAGVRILYGGSISPDNMAEFMEEPDVDGGLVGGASLKVDSFASIVRAALAVRA